MTQTQEKGKNSLWPDLSRLGSNSGSQFCFSKIWLRQSLDIMVSYHNVKYRKKTNDPILKKINDVGKDGRTDEHADGQTDRRTRVIS